MVLPPIFTQDEQDATVFWLSRAVDMAEARLERNKAKLERHESAIQTASPLKRLYQFQNELNHVEMCLDLQHYKRLRQEEEEQKQQQRDVGISSVQTLLEDAQACLMLGNVLLKQQPSESLNQLYNDEYEPLVKYLCNHFILHIRQGLAKLDYPSPIACQTLIQQCHQINHQNPGSSLVDCIVAWIRLSSQHEQLFLQNDNNDQQQKIQNEQLILEICRPLVQRISFHFVNNQQQQQQRVTLQKMDRLPQWLFTYVRQNFFQRKNDGTDNGGGASPWDFISQLAHSLLSQQQSDSPLTIASLLHYQFVNQITQACHYVLYQRNFFRHEQILGGGTYLHLLKQGLEQVLSFDAYLRKLLMNSPWRNTTSKSLFARSRQSSSYKGLTQRLVVQDLDLWQWWLRYEQETMVTTLFATQLSGAVDSNKTKIALLSNIHGISPRAELFCALVHSIQTKALLLQDLTTTTKSQTLSSASAEYISQVGSPLCQEFLEAVHETCNDLKSILRTRRSTLISATDLQKNLLEWMELINGTLLASHQLRHGSGVNNNNNNQGIEESKGPEEADAAADGNVQFDFVRVGHSLQRACNAMIDECASTLVERVILEHARLASYLMRCPHVLSLDHNEDGEDDDIFNDFLPELEETVQILSVVLHTTATRLSLCSARDNNKDNATGGGVDEKKEGSDLVSTMISSFAPHAMRGQVLDRVADKFLEVIVMDIHGIAPEWTRRGALKIQDDLSDLMHSLMTIQLPLPPLVLRLSDCLRFMTLEETLLDDLQMTLAGLVGSNNSRYLDWEIFAQDGTLHDEGVSMIRAKGFKYLPLEDVLSVLNRRKC